MMNQLILNKTELKECKVSVIQSIHSSKRHAYPDNQAVYIIDPLYKEVYSIMSDDNRTELHRWIFVFSILFPHQSILKEEQFYY